MVDRVEVGLRDGAPEREGARQTQRCHGGVDHGLILDSLMIERVLDDGHQCRQRRGGIGHHIARPALDECEGVTGIVRQLQHIRDREDR